MSVAAQVAQGTPRRSRRPQTLTCPGCGRDRDVTYENYRRIVRGELSGKCRDCPGPQDTLPTDADRKFWLKSFGVPASELRGVTALDYIASHGMPAELALVASGWASSTHAP